MKVKLIRYTGNGFVIMSLFFLPPTKEEVYVFARVRLSVCLSVSKITQNACMDSDQILRVDRCQDMDVLINF